MDYTNYVNPSIGGIGHLLTSTSPSVQSPHGAAVVAPLFRPGMKDGYSSDRIFGFTAGCAAVMPECGDNGPAELAGSSRFDHDFETARPDFYEVLLEDHDIRSSHTAMANYGMFRFVFPRGAARKRIRLSVRGCAGLRRSGSRLYLTGQQYVGRAARFHTLFLLPEGAETAEVPNNGEETAVITVTVTQEEVFLPFVLSALDWDSLDESCAADLAGKSFDTVRSECNAAWNRVLGKVRVSGGTEAEKRVFYTALYRSLSRMHNYSVCGRYRGFDGEIHDDEGHAYYTDDGIWDTFRGMHPLQLLLEPEVHRDTLESYLRMYRQSGWLPRFPYLDGNTPCMLGHHTVSLFAEAMAKGLDFDRELAYEAVYKNATRRTMLPWTDGEADELTKVYYEKGFFPALEEDEPETCDRVHSFENRQAVAVTIEHSYDDWCVSQMAAALGKTEDAAYFAKRAENYKKLYDASIGFFHPRKADGSFTEVYNPKFCGGVGGRRYFAENNAYIYDFAAQHDMDGLMELMGGREVFAAKLDRLYVEQYDGRLKSDFLAQYPDATGLMGQFCMGNEPSFHIPYLYDYCGQAYKTQRKIHELIRIWFTDSPLGICGDEDGGAMSAFLAFSAMGFYPVNPASGDYDLGSPIFDRIELNLPNGRTFTVRAEGASGKAKYIQAASINGVPMTAPKFSHAQLMEGGELNLTMGLRPNRDLFA